MVTNSMVQQSSLSQNVWHRWLISYETARALLCCT